MTLIQSSSLQNFFYMTRVLLPSLKECAPGGEVLIFENQWTNCSIDIFHRSQRDAKTYTHLGIHSCLLISALLESSGPASLLPLSETYIWRLQFLLVSSISLLHWKVKGGLHPGTLWQGTQQCQFNSEKNLHCIFYNSLLIFNRLHLKLLSWVFILVFHSYYSHYFPLFLCVVNSHLEVSNPTYTSSTHAGQGTHKGRFWGDLSVLLAPCCMCVLSLWPGRKADAVLRLWIMLIDMGGNQGLPVTEGEPLPPRDWLAYNECVLAGAVPRYSLVS